MGKEDSKFTPNPQKPDHAVLKMTHGKLIFDKDGTRVGVAVADGSLDYVSPEDEEVVVIIQPPKKLTK